MSGSNNNASQHQSMAVPMGAKPDAVDAADWSQLQSALSRETPGIQPQQLRTADPSQLGNDPHMEAVWAEKAFKHALCFYKLCRAVPEPSKLALTRIDEDVYTHFRQEFAHLNVKVIDEDVLKSTENKITWRAFCTAYEQNQSITDYNFATLLRLDASKAYSSTNTCIVPRIQFLAIEIARLREGLNRSLPEPEPES